MRVPGGRLPALRIFTMSNTIAIDLHWAPVHRFLGDILLKAGRQIQHIQQGGSSRDMPQAYVIELASMATG